MIWLPTVDIVTRTTSCASVHLQSTLTDRFRRVTRVFHRSRGVESTTLEFLTWLSLSLSFPLFEISSATEFRFSVDEKLNLRCKADFSAFSLQLIFPRGLAIAETLRRVWEFLSGALIRSYLVDYLIEWSVTDPIQA